MRAALIGHTGFVGGNLLRQAQFDACYHSVNIEEIRGQEFDLIVCAGITALKWWANQNAQEDLARVEKLLDCVTSARAARVYIISTIDVYPVMHGVDESFDCRSMPNHAYGVNRLYFEEAMRAKFADVLVCRLAGVFGPGLKKNVIFDLLHDNGLDVINPRSSFQYYNIAHLWRDLRGAEEAGIHLMNFVHPPLRTGEIIGRFFPDKAVGSRAASEMHYDIRTKFGSSAGYLSDGKQLFAELQDYIEAERTCVQS